MRNKLLIAAALALATAPLVAQPIFQDGFEAGYTIAWSGSETGWAIEETFDGDPAAPSQALLPAHFDFAVTHRTHPRDHTPAFTLYPADHGNDCAGPAPPVPAQHMVATSHETDGVAIDESFFLCKNHMMSSMGDVEGYSVTAFWARQEMDFSDGGLIEVDVNLNDGHPRSWWEILIAPREQLKVGAAQDWLPIDETYPSERIVLTFAADSKRQIQVGTGAVAPGGWTTGVSDWRNWRFIDPTDPAVDDRRIRRTMRIELSEADIRWSIEKQDGSFDTFSAPLPDGLPFHRGLVLFKTHAYTPKKDNNHSIYTFHWDNLRFDGPTIGRYQSFETAELGYLQANGSRPIGDSTTMTIDLPRLGRNAVLHGQLHSPMTGQVLLSVNGGPDRVIHPVDYSEPGCSSSGWSSFRLELDPTEVQLGTNTFQWTIGPRAPCVPGWAWDGFSVKSLEIQLDHVEDAASAATPSTPAPSYAERSTGFE